MISLPVVKIDVVDHSMTSTHSRCPQKFHYSYALGRRSGNKSWPIQYGVAYHTFREILEQAFKRVQDGTSKIEDPDFQNFIYDLAWSRAIAADNGWEDPPTGDAKEYLTISRLASGCEMAFKRWLDEKRLGHIKVLHTEQTFDLQLPFDDVPLRYGGRIDQVIEWNGKLWIRDFKTTTMMGRTYAFQFDPDHQISGYVWAVRELSGRDVEGALIETVYNTKTKGPEFHDFLVTRSRNAIEEWQQDMRTELIDMKRNMDASRFPKRTVACDDYGGCQWREVCLKDSWYTRERLLEASTVHEPWDFMRRYDV